MKTADILIVEDEGLIALAIKISLEKKGHTIVGIVSTAEDALKEASNKRPTLILMDIRINGEHDGILAAVKIREILDIPVIYMTGFSDAATMQRALETNPHAFLVKPVNIDQLQEIILGIPET